MTKTTVFPARTRPHAPHWICQHHTHTAWQWNINTRRHSEQQIYEKAHGRPASKCLSGFTEKLNRGLFKDYSKTIIVLFKKKTCGTNTNSYQKVYHNKPLLQQTSAPAIGNNKQLTDWHQHFTLDSWPNITELECGPMPNVMATLPNTGGALGSTLQSLADAHY